MVLHPTMVWIKSMAGRMVNSDWFEAATCMGAFGGDTLQPTKVYGNRRLVLALTRSWRQATRAGIIGDSTLDTTVEIDCDTNVMNISYPMQIQAYPDNFGQSVLDAYVAMGHRDEIPDDGPGLDGPYAYPQEVWELADIESVLGAVPSP